ncbi:hypothetical protein [Hazenella coriacea]|uniref:Uncharacterized protein n=1 Tax=Hazenella coriacea TaxID=1179467 RepID=A0A4R3L419_9BACL|nr:hypothetical protein [Hazenella coriacea]TCS94299.1 hypothetical protein EDD58_104170 [Hazenella coriacea]
MHSIILIGDENFGIESVTQVSHAGNVKGYMLNKTRYVVEFEDGHIYYDFIADIIDEYDEEELLQIPFASPHFITMTYTSETLMMRTLLQNDFLRGIYIDNDHGMIIPIEEFIKHQ